MNRILFTLQERRKHQLALHAYLKNSEKSCPTILDLTPQMLQAKNIEILVLDFDGVLASHEGSLLPSVLAWLTDLAAHWHKPIYIFSNKPLPAREAFFKAHFPEIGFIKNVAQKPYPEGLLQLAQATKIKPEQILMVDDRLLTGILAALLAGTQGLWIRKPYQDFKLHPIKEAWFQLLRWLDRILIHASVSGFNILRLLG